MTHYKGKYRIRCEYDQVTKQFQRKLDGTYEDIDCYIDCYNNIRIFYYGRAILEAYIPSITRGHNIVKAIQNDLGRDSIFDIEENDSEISFHFKAKNMDKMEQYLKPKISGANISPFSSKNLPKNKEYKIPYEDLVPYKRIVENIGKTRIIELTHMTRDYLKSLANKNRTWDAMKADMALRGLSGKNYIHAIGKWEEYIDFLKNKLSKRV